MSARGLRQGYFFGQFGRDYDVRATQVRRSVASLCRTRAYDPLPTCGINAPTSLPHPPVINSPIPTEKNLRCSRIPRRSGRLSLSASQAMTDSHPCVPTAPPA